MALANALTKEELQYLQEQSKSELMRVVRKRLEWVYSLESAKMGSNQISDPTSVFRQQGIMQGILMSVNFLQAFELYSDSPKDKT